MVKRNGYYQFACGRVPEKDISEDMVRASTDGFDGTVSFKVYVSVPVCKTVQPPVNFQHGDNCLNYCPVKRSGEAGKIKFAGRQVFKAVIPAPWNKEVRIHRYHVRCNAKLVRGTGWRNMKW
jgi:hypothetical protein